MTATSEVLNKAADLIQERGWGQGPDTWIGAGGLCLEGGIAAAIGVVPHGIDRETVFRTCPAYRAVETYLGDDLRAVDPNNCGLYRWNDQAPRTENEVIEVLRAAALIEAAKENSSVEANETVAA